MGRCVGVSGDQVAASPADRRVRVVVDLAGPRRTASTHRAERSVGGSGASWPGPRRPRRIKLWRDRTALITCGTTVSSYPRMPGNSASPRWILQIKLLRISSFTLRLASLAFGEGAGAKYAKSAGQFL